MMNNRTGRLYQKASRTLPLSVAALAALFVTAQTGVSRQLPEQTGGTFRVRVGLVQVDLTVTDRQGDFVEGLKADQLELLVDGEPQPISFLEMISTKGPAGETALAGTGSGPNSGQISSTSSLPESGRTILFFLDDWHLSPESIMRSRRAISSLIDNVMGPNDRAAVFTASRQLGFLQQVTDNKAILKQAVARLGYTNAAVGDLSRPAMNEAQALAIEQDDLEILEFFVESTMYLGRMLESERGEAEEIVRFRASGIAEVSAAVTARSLASLRSILRSCAVLPGRKLVFYLSDGFVLHQQRDDVAYRLKQVTEAAMNAGIVIYSLDTRGLMVDLPNDVPGILYATPPPSLLGGGFSDVGMAQDGLNALASDTGGRLLMHTNAFEHAIIEGLKEASRYYLLGWYVDQERLQPGRYSLIKVQVKDRPDLRVQVRQDSLDLTRLVLEEKGRAALTTPRNVDGKELAMALQYPWPIEGLPASVYPGFVYDPAKNQYLLDILFQVDSEGVDASGASESGAGLNLLGIVANRDGVTVGGFEVNPSQPKDPADRIQWNGTRFSYSRVVQIQPGIYQVRVAARDPRSGLVGSAHQWVEIPVPAAGKIQLGSIFLKEPVPGVSSRSGFHPDSFDDNAVSAGRRFPPGVDIPFLVQVFHASGADILMGTKIYQGNQVARSTEPVPVAAPSRDHAGRLFIGGDLSTKGLTAGSYVLEISVTDPVQNITSTQRIAFWIQ